MIRATCDKGQRRIHITGIPTDLTEPGLKNLPPTLDIVINYASDDPTPVLCKAITLDNIVIPAIVEALNRRRSKPLV